MARTSFRARSHFWRDLPEAPALLFLKRSDLICKIRSYVRFLIRPDPLGKCQRAPNPSKFAPICTRRPKRPKQTCTNLRPQTLVCELRIGTNLHKFAPPRGRHPSRGPTGSGGCKFVQVWSLLKVGQCFGNPNPYNWSKTYGSTPPICTAVRHTPFVSPCFPGF